MDIANRLAELRKKTGLTQAQLAAKINYSDKVISKWERGESLPDIEALTSLASFYQMSLDDLIKNTESPKGAAGESVNNKYLQGNLNALRRNKGLQPADVSAYVKIEEARLKSLESGTAAPVQEELDKLAKFYGVSTADLLSPVKIPKPKMRKRKKLLIVFTPIVSVIVLITIIFSILAAVQGSRIYKDLRGTYYLSRIKDDINREIKDTDSAIAMLKTDFNWFNTKLTVNDNKELVFEGKTPIKYRISFQDNIPNWFVDGMGPNGTAFHSGEISFPNKEIRVEKNYTNCAYSLNSPNGGNYIVVYTVASDGKKYQLDYCTDVVKSLEYKNQAVNYNLSRIYSKITGMPDQEIPSTDSNYNTYKSTYGETIKLYESKVEFSGTMTAPLNSKATYTKSGNNITFTDSTVSMLCSASLDGNKFNLIISMSADAALVIEYVTS